MTSDGFATVNTSGKRERVSVGARAGDFVVGKILLTRNDRGDVTFSNLVIREKTGHVKFVDTEYRLQAGDLLLIPPIAEPTPSPFGRSYAEGVLGVDDAYIEPREGWELHPRVRETLRQTLALLDRRDAGTDISSTEWFHVGMRLVEALSGREYGSQRPIPDKEVYEWHRLVDLAYGLGYTVRLVEDVEDAQPLVDYTNKEIKIREILTPKQRVAVLRHEIAHVQGKHFDAGEK